MQPYNPAAAYRPPNSRSSSSGSRSFGQHPHVTKPPRRKADSDSGTEDEKGSTSGTEEEGSDVGSFESDDGGRRRRRNGKVAKVAGSETESGEEDSEDELRRREEKKRAGPQARRKAESSESEESSEDEDEGTDDEDVVLRAGPIHEGVAGGKGVKGAVDSESEDEEDGVPLGARVGGGVAGPARGVGPMSHAQHPQPQQPQHGQWAGSGGHAPAANMHSYGQYTYQHHQQHPHQPYSPQQHPYQHQHHQQQQPYAPYPNMYASHQSGASHHAPHHMQSHPYAGLAGSRHSAVPAPRGQGYHSPQVQHQHHGSAVPRAGRFAPAPVKTNRGSKGKGRAKKVADSDEGSVSESGTESE